MLSRPGGTIESVQSTVCLTRGHGHDAIGSAQRMKMGEKEKGLLCWLRQESQQVLWVHGRQSQIELKTARRSARPQLWTSARAKIDCKVRERSPFYDGKLENGKDREVTAIRQVSHNVRDIELMKLFSSGRVGSRWRLTEVIIYRGLWAERKRAGEREGRKKSWFVGRN